MARVPYSHELYAMSRHIVFCAAPGPIAPPPRAHAAPHALGSRRYKEIMAKSPEEFKEFAQCLDWYGLRFSRCRDKQAAFEKAFPVVEPKQ